VLRLEALLLRVRHGFPLRVRALEHRVLILQPTDELGRALPPRLAAVIPVHRALAGILYAHLSAAVKHDDNTARRTWRLASPTASSHRACGVRNLPFASFCSRQVCWMRRAAFFALVSRSVCPAALPLDWVASEAMIVQRENVFLRYLRREGVVS
jgi:hypothetical protein